MEVSGSDQHTAHHVHESPRVMTIPLIVLAVGSALAGYLGLPAWLGTNVFEHFLEPALETAATGAVAHGGGGHGGYAVELMVTAVSIFIAGFGILLAYFFFIRRQDLPARLLARFGGIHKIVYSKYYVDEIYDALFVNRTKDLGNGLYAFDQRVVDGVVNGSAVATRITAWLSGQADIHIVDRLVNIVAEFMSFASGTIRKLQTGLVQRYALFFVLGIILVIGFYLYMGA